MIKSISWVITGKCNGRCVHCDIWRVKPAKAGLSLRDIDLILSDEEIRWGYEHFGKEYDISFAGGEPFLRADLQQIIDLVEQRYPGSFKSITTNGLLSDRVLAFVTKNYRLGFKLNVSIDGLQAAHDAVRGKGAFKKTMRTVLMIRKRCPRQAVELKLTLSPHNYDQILNVCALARELGCAFSFKPAEDLRNFTNTLAPLDIVFTQEQLRVVKDQCAEVAALIRAEGDDGKAAFYKDIPPYLAGKKNPRTCSVLNQYLTIMPDGTCFFCMKEPAVGKVPGMAISDLKKVRSPSTFRCKSCMLLCGAYKDYARSRGGQ